jgi:hypothetical protein
MNTTKDQKLRRDDARSNDNQLNRDTVAALAYSIWLARGCREGTAQEDWLRAEEQVRQLDLLEQHAAA